MAFLQGAPPAGIGGALIWIGIVQAIIYLLFIRAVDLYEREALRYVIPVFIWGFAVATTASLFFNTIASFTISTIAGQQVASFLTPVMVAPVVEESTKGLALLIIFLVSYVAARRRGGLAHSTGVMACTVSGRPVGFGVSVPDYSTPLL